jgi:hypothetical protein
VEDLTYSRIGSMFCREQRRAVDVMTVAEMLAAINAAGRTHKSIAAELMVVRASGEPSNTYFNWLNGTSKPSNKLIVAKIEEMYHAEIS